jgi:hypothetical protein
MDQLEYNTSAASRAAERAVVVDLWRYTALLAGILLAITAFFSGSLSAMALTATICLVGGGLITLITHTEFDSARRLGRAPRIHRIFE